MALVALELLSKKKAEVGTFWSHADQAELAHSICADNEEAKQNIDAGITHLRVILAS